MDSCSPEWQDYPGIKERSGDFLLAMSGEIAVQEFADFVFGYLGARIPAVKNFAEFQDLKGRSPTRKSGPPDQGLFG